MYLNWKVNNPGEVNLYSVRTFFALIYEQLISPYIAVNQPVSYLFCCMIRKRNVIGGDFPCHVVTSS